MSATPENKPRARTGYLITEPVDDEVMVYILDEHKALRLNPVAARVWERCDGESSTAEIAEGLSQETGAPVETELVDYTIARLAKANLLESDGGVTSAMNRRQLIGRLGIAAGALPVIFSLTAPRAFAQNSPLCISMDQCDTNPLATCGTPCTTKEVSSPQNCVKVCAWDDFTKMTKLVCVATDDECFAPV